MTGEGEALLKPFAGPDSLLSPLTKYDKNLSQLSPRWGMCVWREARKAKERLTAFLPSLPLVWVTLARSEQLTRV